MIFSNLLFQHSPGCYRWLFPAVISPPPGVKKSKFPPPKPSGRCSFRCIYQRYQPAPEIARKAIARAPALMSLVPASGPAGLDDQRHRELAMWSAGAFHDHPDGLRSRLDFSLRDLEQQLVVDLQQHTGAQPFGGKGCRNAGHGALDDVGGRALERRVDRLALGAGAA